ncbi:Lipase (class 3) [Microbulbifer donghaiensis]|uniref:Lipase (Class 3) n=1 Tax=Microbulbifer donghaiensis TaxID=494016 RepID=A0A1M5EEE2_9GAMM|nr:lipase family protein [Microbulbifer donghaiensis]SHF77462.1 Lipase (class 3) [Microbulbifer donghaiensis]
MSHLEPLYAARLAQDIYDLNTDIRRDDFLRVYQSDFETGKDNSLKGKTGALTFLKNEHTIGIASNGVGRFKGQSFIALKGTASLYDGLTDLNAGLKRFHTGGQVHQGFYYTFSSFLPQIEEFVQQLPVESHTIHCVGHSLGGALATLTADWLACNTEKSIKLYTFGSPRVGLNHFSSNCRRRLTEESIFRVYHRNDPVPMVPTWPFIHVPDGGKGDLQVRSPDSLNPVAHHSSDTYRKSVSEDNKGSSSLEWDVLRKRRPQGYLQQSMEAWLKSDSVLSLTMNTAWLAGEALLWVLKKIGNLAAIALVASGSTTFTLLDRLAIFMHNAYQISKEISFWVLRLIKRLAQLVGVTIKSGASLTVEFIRTIFLRVHAAVAELVARASRTLH